ERLISFRSFEDLLLAEIGVARCCGDVTTFGPTWYSGRKGRWSLLARQLRLVRSLCRALICQRQKEHAQRRDHPGQMMVEARSHKHDHLLPCSSLTLQIFSAISMRRLKCQSPGSLERSRAAAKTIVDHAVIAHTPNIHHFAVSFHHAIEIDTVRVCSLAMPVMGKSHPSVRAGDAAIE